VGSNVAFPSDIFYQLTDVKRYNLDIDSKPLAISYPQSNIEVAAVIKCATTFKAKVQARSGGHSYGNYGEYLFVSSVEQLNLANAGFQDSEETTPIPWSLI